MTMTAAPHVQPIAGPRFKRACRLQIEDEQRRKLLLLICAYHDAGHDPSVVELSRRLGEPRIPRIDSMLQGLESHGLLVIERRRPERNRYRILSVD